MPSHGCTSVPILPSLSAASVVSPFSSLAGRRTSVCPPSFITGHGSHGAGSGGGGHAGISAGGVGHASAAAMAGAGSSFLQQIGSGVVSRDCYQKHSDISIRKQHQIPNI